MSALRLYHADTAVCAAKVRLALAEKELPWEGELLNLGRGDQFSPAYLALNPHGVVPTLVHDGATVTESTIINEYLDEAFPDRPLRPQGALGHARVRAWTKREDTIHDAINTMTVVLVFRPVLLAKSESERAKRWMGIPDATRRVKWRDLLEHGVASSHVRDALLRFATLFRDMDTRLAGGEPFLLGDAVTLADIGFVSFFYRLELMQMKPAWEDNFPHVAQWFERWRARESFATAIADYIPAARVEEFATTCAPLAAEVKRAFVSAVDQVATH